MRVCLYTRISTQEQKKGASISEQVTFLRSYCKQNKYKVVAEFCDEGFSGTKEKRPDFSRMIEGIEKGTLDVDAVLVRSSDRWFRNHVLDSQYRTRLSEKDVSVISTDRPAPSMEEDQSPAEWFGQSVMALNDEMYSKMVSFHTRKSMLASAKTNQFLGGKIPFGYRVIEGHNSKPYLDVDPQQSNTVLLIFEFYVKKGFTLAQVVKELRRMGVKDQHAKFFTIQRVHYILSNETYIGRRVYNRTKAGGKKRRDQSEWVYQDVPPIVDVDVFERAQELKESRAPSRVYMGTAPNSQYALSDLCFCKACGAKLIHRTAKGGRYEYYECSGAAKGTKAHCSAMTRHPKDLLEDSVIDVIGERLLIGDRVMKIVGEMHRLRANAGADIEDLKRQQIAVEKELQVLYRELTTGEFPRETLLPEIQRRSNRKAELEFQIQRREAMQKIPLEVYSLPNLLETLNNIWDWLKAKKEPKRINALLKLFVSRIEIHGDEVMIKAHLNALQTLQGTNRYGGFFPDEFIDQVEKGKKFLLSSKDGSP